MNEFRSLNGAKSRPGGRAAALDRHLDALWYISRNPCCRRGLPGEFGPWFAVFQFFSRLSHTGFFDFLHGRLVCGNEAEADIMGRLAAKLIFTPGNTSDHTAAPELTKDLENTAAVADKGYYKKALREPLRSRGCEPCIPCRSHVKNSDPYDAILYRSRHAIENLFQRIKVFRRVAARYEKTKRMFLMFTTFALSCHCTKFRLWPSVQTHPTYRITYLPYYLIIDLPPYKFSFQIP